MKLVFYRSEEAEYCYIHIIQPNVLQSSLHDSSVDNKQVSILFFIKLTIADH